MPTTPLGPGQVYSIEQGVHLSNVALIDPIQKYTYSYGIPSMRILNRIPTKVAWKFVTDESGLEKKIRVSKLSGAEIPKPTPEVKKRVHSIKFTLNHVL